MALPRQTIDKVSQDRYSIGSDGVHVTSGIFREQTFTFAEKNAFPFRSPPGNPAGFQVTGPERLKTVVFKRIETRESPWLSRVSMPADAPACGAANAARSAQRVNRASAQGAPSSRNASVASCPSSARFTVRRSPSCAGRLYSTLRRE